MKTIRLTEVLDYDDAIQIFAARDPAGDHYVCVMIDTVGNLGRYAVVGVSLERLAEFQAGRVDLRTLLLEAPDGEWYIAVVDGTIDNPLPLEPQRESLAETDYLPDAGFFLEGATPAGNTKTQLAMPDTTTNRRLIEDWLPIKEISVEAIREGGALAGHPPVNQLHVWWARRPLVASRAAVAATLLNANADRKQFIQALGSTDTVVEERRRMDEIKASGQWSKVKFSNKRAFTHNLTAAERAWFQSNLAVADPLVLDVTAGGGSIPFETGRLGIQNIANELNPVATLILRATCEWPQQYGPALRDAYAEVSVRYLALVRKLIAENAVYPPEPQDHNNENSRFSTVRLHKYVWAYLWSRTVHCPDCGSLIPLSPNWRLDGAGTGIRLLPDPDRGVCDFEVVNASREQSRGTVARGKATCPYPNCGATTATGYLADEARAGRMGHQLYCVILKNQWQKTDGKGGWVNIRRPKDQQATPPREFRTVRPEDDNTAHVAALLEANKAQWDANNLLPNEAVPDGKGREPINYGMERWVKMFSPRQQLAHGYCVQAFRALVDSDADAGRLDDCRKAAWSYVAIAIDKLINRNSLMSRWVNRTSVVVGTFDSHDFGMKWSYAEMAVAIESLGLEWALTDIGECINKLTEMSGYPPNNGKSNPDTQALLDMPAASSKLVRSPATEVVNGDARMLDLDDSAVDAIVFDPPYHNNVNYAELSDFFYVWLKRTAGYVLDNGLFSDHLTDKVNEAIANPARFRQQAGAANAGRKGRGKVTATGLATDDYQNKMDEIFRECHRVIKHETGIMVVMFTHRSNDAWNAMTIGLMEAGFNITRTWPVKTEAESSLHIRNRAAARTTILLVCRPAGVRNPQPWHQVAQEIAAAVRNDMARLQEYDLSPVDTYLAAYGPALQVISENWGTRRDTANPDRPDDPFRITPMDALAVARNEVIAFRAEQLAGGNRQNLTDPLTWFYILAQDGTGSTTMPFDEANLFARALGVELAGHGAKRVLQSKSGKVTLKAATERMAEGIIAPSRPAVTPLDQVHTAIAITDRQNAETARQWLEFNGHRWQDGAFRTAFEALHHVRKPGHPDEPAARALHTLLYEAERPTQATLPGATETLRPANSATPYISEKTTAAQANDVDCRDAAL